MANITKAERERREAVARAEKAEKELAEIRGKVRDRAVQLATDNNLCGEVYEALEDIGIVGADCVRIAIWAEYEVYAPAYTDIPGYEHMSTEEKAEVLEPYLLQYLKAERVADQFRFDARIPHRFVQDDEVATKLGYRIEVIDIES